MAPALTPDSPPATIELLGRAPIKRARAQLSCTPCRQGKLKCNREQPVCDQCMKRSRQDACQFVPPPTKNKQAQNMRGRIRNLESLVVNLINQKEQGPKDGEEHNGMKDGDEVSPETFGELRISNSGNDTQYVGAGHWSAVLKEIEEVKMSLEDDDDPTLDQELDDSQVRSVISFGMPSRMTKAQLLAAMPPKNVIDKMLPLWFNSADPLLFIIHAPTFQEEYKQFWQDPSSMSVMWIALLYSALALGIILGPRNPGMNANVAPFGKESTASFDPVDPNDHLLIMINKFQHLASSAIALADIAKSQPYVIETLMVYGQCEFLRRDDRHTKVWLMGGVVLRVALRMGYHRDPSNFDNLSPFQGEMRRRIWHVLNMMDTLVSFAIGLPALVRRVESDVRAPRNYYDADISPATEKLPQARPLSELTPATYTIAKSKVCAVFAEAAELSQKVVPPRYSTVVALEKRLEEAYDQVPDLLRMRPLEDCITDSPVLIMSRFNIKFLYLKTKLVLHRTYMTPGQKDPKYADSRNICIDAALGILRHQELVFHACEPGGQLNKVWWYMSSLQTYDHLLAAMILSLELNYLKSTDESSQRAADLYAALQRTYDIWKAHPVRFYDAVRGAEILKTMLTKCATPGGIGSTSRSTAPTMNFNGFDDPAKLTPESMPEELPPAIWGNWLSSEGPAIDEFDVPSEIDWMLFDSTMQNQDHMLPSQSWAMSTNPTMETWMDATSNVDYMIANGMDGFENLIEPAHMYGPNIFHPPPPNPMESTG